VIFKINNHIILFVSKSENIQDGNFDETTHFFSLKNYVNSSSIKKQKYDLEIIMNERFNFILLRVVFNKNSFKIELHSTRMF